MTDAPAFSVIIPICHGGRFLAAALASAAALDGPADGVEVLAVGGADDTEARQAVETAAAAARFPVRFLGIATANRSARLNLACGAARGRVLAFADDDCVLPRDWLGRLDGALAREGPVGVLGGRDELADGGTTFDVALDWVLQSFLGTGGVRGPHSRVGAYYPKLWNMAVPRPVAEAAATGTREGRPQVFDEGLEVHEDVDLARRIAARGGRLVHAPEVRVRHARDTTFGRFLARNFCMARTCRRLGAYRGAHVALAAGVLGVPMTAAVAFVVPVAGWALAGGLAVYALLLASSAVRASVARRRLGLLWRVPAMLAGVHAMRGLGFLLPWSMRHA